VCRSCNTAPIKYVGKLDQVCWKKGDQSLIAFVRLADLSLRPFLARERPIRGTA